MFKFREIKEVKDDFETRTTVEEEEKGFMQIKPKTDMTVDEAIAFVNSLFDF